MSARILLFSVAIAGLLSQSLHAQSETRRGAVGGGAAGAVIGGIIGHQNDETAEGVLIGGAIGAIAGGLMGQERDQQVYRDYRYQQQQVVRYQNGLSFHDAVALSQSGVGPQVIINQIQMNGVQRRPGVNEIIALHQQGVPESVINAMQQSRLATESAPIVYQRPVVVEEYRPAPVVIYRQPQIYRAPQTTFHLDIGTGRGHRAHHHHHGWHRR